MDFRVKDETRNFVIMKNKVNILWRYSLLLFMMVALANFTYGQRVILGTITTDNGELLIGATVLIPNTKTMTTTDLNGAYTLNIPNETTQLKISYTSDYATQLVNIGTSNVVDVVMKSKTIIGYGTQKKAELTSAIVEVGEKDFNQGTIADPAQLLQGKVAGLQIYNRGGNPNQQSTIRIRGLSGGSAISPLIVIDGIIGASLQSVDPNDIERISVLKDGSAAAIYGIRGSNGVLIVTTKKGIKSKKLQWAYNGQVAAESVANSINNMNASEFIAAGGFDLGAQTDWIDEVTKNPVNHNHGLAIASGFGKNGRIRISANYRDREGILENTGFKKFNARLNFSGTAFKEKLKIDFHTSYTNIAEQNGYVEALRYAVFYNPTAPVLGADSPFPFDSDQFGGFFETLGLFDSFNPVSIITQNKKETTQRMFNYGANLTYDLTDNLSFTLHHAQQKRDISTIEFAPTTALFLGNAASPTRKGVANLNDGNIDFSLYEIYSTYLTSLANGDLRFTAGYSFQQDNFSTSFFSFGDFQNNLNHRNLNLTDLIRNAQNSSIIGFNEASINHSPTHNILALFGRANLTFDDAIFVNASIRREGTSKLSPTTRWGWFPALGVGVDLTKYLEIGAINLFKVGLSYGATGTLRNLGVSQEVRRIVSNGQTGAVSTQIINGGNPALKFEKKRELNLGIEVAVGKFSAALDLYNRTIDDVILERDAGIFGVTRPENAGKLNTKGVELTLNYAILQKGNLTYNTGVLLSTYKTKLQKYVLEANVLGNLGAPGQNGVEVILLKEGAEIGNIWGPVYTGVDAVGNPIFADVNGDGMLQLGQDRSLDPDVDFEILGNGIPDLELGWTNQVSVGDWSVNAFFRGAFGHSLVNTFRVFYEPRLSGQSSYNFVNTTLAIPELRTARFSSLYVEKADFFKLDNLTISKRFAIKNDYFQAAQVSFMITNAFVISKYTGTNPEPNLVDTGLENMVGTTNFDGLAPGIDRRNNYFAARTFVLGVNLKF